jgi:hypothetical protein
MFDCNQSVTVYNRLKNPNDLSDSESFLRFILPVKCKWIHSTDRDLTGSAAYIEDGFKLIIPYTECYLPFDLWDNADEGERIGHFTIKPGDLMFLGDKYVDAVENSFDTMEDMKKAFYPHWFTVKGFTDNTDSQMGKHWIVYGE